MIRNVRLWAVFTATLVFAQRGGGSRCDGSADSEHPAPTTNAVVF
jgi:hypothetical protein